MNEADRVLRPLRAEASVLERLGTYETPAELASALVTTWDAVERSLRLLLRSDTGAPEEARLAALSVGDLPFDALITALRRRNRITMELAGRLHELERVAARASAGDVRAADADAAIETTGRLESEVSRLSAPAPVAESPVTFAEPEVPRRRVWPALLILLLVAAGAGVLVLRDGEPDLAPGIAQFEAGELDAAASYFETALRADSVNVTALLYLARIHRRGSRPEEAATLLERAVAVAPEDADVRRELGWLFMDLGRPESAVEQFDRARTAEPEEAAGWIGLIRALRATQNPLAEQRLREAPADVRAAFAAGG